MSTSAYLTRRKEKYAYHYQLTWSSALDSILHSYFLAHKITKLADKSYMLLRTNKRSDRMEIIDCIEIVKKT